MRFAQLRYAEAAIRLGSLRRAATEQGIAQPSLSQQIKRLEEDLGVVLFVRRPSGVQATDAALNLLEVFRKALRVEEAMRQSATAVSELKKGFVRVGVVPTMSRLFMPQAVAQFQAMHPQVHIELHEDGSLSLRDAVRNGTLDFALVPAWVGEDIQGLWAVELFRTNYVVCVPKGHPYENARSLNGGDLSGHPMVVHKGGYFSRRLFDEISDRYPLDPVVFADNTDSILRYVAAGVGLSLVPEIAVDPSRQDYLVVPFDQKETVNRVVIVRRLDEQPAPASQAMMVLLRERAQDLMSGFSYEEPA